MAEVRLFASLREMAGASHVVVEGETIGEVSDALAARYGPEFARRMETSRIWKNGEEGVPADPVSDSDELAVIPPVSGGAVGSPGVGIEGVILAGVAFLLLGANVLGTPYLIAVWVGVIAFWVADLALSSAYNDFKVDYRPLWAAILVSLVATNTLGLAGLGVGSALSILIVMGWPLVMPGSRDVTVVSASVIAALVASLSVSSILLTRISASGDGDSRIAGLVIIALLGTLVGRLVERSRARRADPYMMGSLAVVGTALVVAYVAGFEILPWFFMGLVIAGAVIAGRGIGSAFRTGAIKLASRADGYLTTLDGPVLAVAVFLPALRLIG